MLSMRGIAFLSTFRYTQILLSWVSFPNIIITSRTTRTSRPSKAFYFVATVGTVGVAAFASNHHPILPNQRYKVTTTSTTCSPRRPPLKMTAQFLDHVGFLDAESAAKLDEELMTLPGFTLEQLMELAGLSVAEAVFTVLLEQRKFRAKEPDEQDSYVGGTNGKILIVAGPGNNGGDGLVAARHLVHFGYTDVVIVYPKQSSRQPHYANLVKQCEDLNIKILESMPDDILDDNSSYLAVIDSIFGFSFKGEPREPFATILKQIMEMQNKKGVTVFSVDIPSGWNVDEGDINDSGFLPDVLISLTAPKLSAKSFPNRHFIGGRFVPPGICEKYGIRMPPYPGVSQVVEVGGEGKDGKRSSPYSWESEYASYLAEKEANEFADYRAEKPSEESWEAQYQAYLIEKESRLND